MNNQYEIYVEQFVATQVKDWVYWIAGILAYR